MEDSAAVDIFAALAHPTRLALFRLLIREGWPGLAAGVIAERLGVTPSTLSHHLAGLERCGLIEQNRRQRSLIYAIKPELVQSLMQFLADDCCGGRPELCGLPSL